VGATSPSAVVGCTVGSVGTTRVPHAAVAAQALVASPPQESVQLVIVDAALPQAVGHPGLQVMTPEGVQSHSAALHATVSVLLVGVVKVSSALVHSAPPFEGAGSLQVRVFVPDVPQAVALQDPYSLHPPSTPHAAVAAQALVVATPHELVQVEIVEAAVPQAVGQSGLQVTTPLGVHATSAEATQLTGPDQQIVVFISVLHRPSAGSHVRPD